MRRLLIVPFILLGAAPSGAEERETNLQWTLRSGYDANPRDDTLRRGAGLLGYTLALDHQHVRDDQVLDVSAAIQNDVYAPAVAEPNTLYRASLDHAAKLGDVLTHRLVATAARETDDATRRASLTLRQRIEARSDILRVFNNAETRLVSLNERNVLLGSDFLSDSQDFSVNTLTPGVALSKDGNEAGVSLAMSSVRYTEPLDYLGFGKDQRRLQPFFFYAFKLADLKVEGSFSQAFVSWPQQDFSPLAKFLYNVEATLPVGPFALSGSSSRTMEDTTFPTASLALLYSHEARLTWKADETNALGVFWRQRRRTYLEVDLSAKANVLGAEYARRFAGDAVLTLTGYYKEIKTTGSTSLSAFGAVVALQQKLSWK